jgi:hypothetical protein
MTFRDKENTTVKTITFKIYYFEQDELNNQSDFIYPEQSNLRVRKPFPVSIIDPFYMQIH